MRKVGTKTAGTNWTDEELKAVWNKGIVVPGLDKDKYRKDMCGDLIEFSKHGVAAPGGMGWEVDHIKPVAAQGSDDLANLQPLQWETNRAKGDTWPGWVCPKKEKK